MPCTVHCLVTDDEQLAPMRERIARAGIADERVYVVWRGPATRMPTGATLSAWGFMLAPAAWWWSQAMREWIAATEHVIGPRPAGSELPMLNAQAGVAAASPDAAGARKSSRPSTRGKRASPARGRGAAQAAKSSTKHAAKPPAKAGRRGRSPVQSLSSSASQRAKVAALRRKGPPAAGKDAEVLAFRLPAPAVRKAARLARAARAAAACNANGRPQLRLIEGGLTTDGTEPQPPGGGKPGKRRGRATAGRGGSHGSGRRASSTSAKRDRGPRGRAESAARAAAAADVSAAAAPKGAGTTSARGGKTGVGAPVPGRGRRSGPA